MSILDAREPVPDVRIGGPRDTATTSMRELHLIRHAKSCRDDGTRADFDRPLSERGRRDAPCMARQLAEQMARQPARGPSNITRLVTSPALRALQTARLFAPVLEVTEHRFDLRPEVYEATAATLLALINSFPADAARVALIGHNPGISTLARLLAPCPFVEMPTCAVISLAFDRDWDRIEPQAGRVLCYLTPEGIR